MEYSFSSSRNNAASPKINEVSALFISGNYEDGQDEGSGVSGFLHWTFRPEKKLTRKNKKSRGQGAEN